MDNRDIFFDFFSMTVSCVFSLESPHQSDSNENKQYTIFKRNTKNHPKLSQICSYGIFSKGLKNEFETAVVNESSVFEPLEFCCILHSNSCKQIALILIRRLFLRRLNRV